MGASVIMSEMRSLCSWDMFFVLLFAVACFSLEIDGVLRPHERPIPEQRITLTSGSDIYVKTGVMDHAYVPGHEQIVSSMELYAISFGLPMGGLSLGVLWRQQHGDAAAFVKGFLLAMACTIVCVDSTKCYVGYIRPYFYDMCGFDAATGKCAHDVPQAHMSFPSGHSSMSFDAMMFLTLYAVGKVNPAVAKPTRFPLIGDMDVTNLMLLLALAPMAVALWVSSSRIRENDHHPADVVGGAVIGTLWAIFWHARYYPSVWDEDSASPRLRFPADHGPVPQEVRRARTMP